MQIARPALRLILQGKSVSNCSLLQAMEEEKQVG